MKEIKIIEEDTNGETEYIIDEIDTIIIKNKLGKSFTFDPFYIKSIEIIYDNI